MHLLKSVKGNTVHLPFILLEQTHYSWNVNKSSNSLLKRKLLSVNVVLKAPSYDEL